MSRLLERSVLPLLLVGGVLPLAGTTLLKAHAGIMWLGGCMLLVLASIVVARVRATNSSWWQAQVLALLGGLGIVVVVGTVAALLGCLARSSPLHTLYDEETNAYQLHRLAATAAVTASS